MADRAGDLLLSGYRLGGLLARPFIPLFIASRVRAGKEKAERIGERYGRPSAKRPAGQVIWVHAASVGETNAVLPLVARLTRAGFPVLFTTTTVTSAEIAAKALPAEAVHQFGPLDVATYVDRFLDHWRPYFVIFAESELWPTVIARLERAVVPLVIVNGRVSDRSFRRWQRVPAAARALLSRLSLVLAQSDKDAERFRVLGAPKVAMPGNLKFDTPALAADGDEVARLKAAIGARPVWLAASTHEGEEAMAAAAHLQLRRSRGDLLTIIVPRHPGRGDAVRNTLAGMGLSVAQRSRGETVAASTDVYLADTLGELGLFYRLAPATFLGGSLVPTGGHNPIEPLQLGSAVLHGPHVHNFSTLFEVLDAVAPEMKVADAAALAGAVDRRLADSDGTAAIAARSLAALSPLSGALDATMTALKPYLAGKFYSP